MTEAELKELKERRNHLMTQATQAAYKYACECEVGPERSAAFDIYENLRTAGRVY